MQRAFGEDAAKGADLMVVHWFAVPAQAFEFAEHQSSIANFSNRLRFRLRTDPVANNGPPMSSRTNEKAQFENLADRLKFSHLIISKTRRNYVQPFDIIGNRDSLYTTCSSKPSFR